MVARTLYGQSVVNMTMVVSTIGPAVGSPNSQPKSALCSRPFGLSASQVGDASPASSRT